MFTNEIKLIFFAKEREDSAVQCDVVLSSAVMYNGQRWYFEIIIILYLDMMLPVTHSSFFKQTRAKPGAGLQTPFSFIKSVSDPL